VATVGDFRPGDALLPPHDGGGRALREPVVGFLWGSWNPGAHVLAWQCPLALRVHAGERAFQRSLECVVRDRIELSTFRFSGGAVALLTENVPAWKVPAGCPRPPVIAVVVVTVVVGPAHGSD